MYSKNRKIRGSTCISWLSSSANFFFPYCFYFSCYIILMLGNLLRLGHSAKFFFFFWGGGGRGG